MNKRNIFLVGLMGAGKTTVGRQLAAELKLPFFDSDHVIEERSGADISWIFDVEGEEGFRRREAEVIDELTQRPGVVLATGGGAIIRADNRRNLASRGVVVYLDSTVAELVRRTGSGKQSKRPQKRPLLRDDPVGTLTRLMTERAPLYREIADVVVRSERRSSRLVAAEVIEAINASVG